MRPSGLVPPGRFCVFMGLPRAMLARSHSPVPLTATFVSVTRQLPTETEVNMAIINLRDYYPFYMNTPPETVPLDRTNGAPRPLKWCVVTASMVH